MVNITRVRGEYMHQAFQRLIDWSIGDAIRNNACAAINGPNGFYTNHRIKASRDFAWIERDSAFVQQVVAQLPWGHVVRLLENVKDTTHREWYARQAIEHGRSRNVLMHQIESNLYER